MAGHAPIVLSSHPGVAGERPTAVRWGAGQPEQRGPVIATPGARGRNAIGTHSGAYSVYRALAVAAGRLDALHRPDLSLTRPAASIGPFPQWEGEGAAARIVSLDPWGHIAPEVFAESIAAGLDIRPTIAVTRAHINMPEMAQAMRDGRLAADGDVLRANGDARVTKIAIEPVWWLPGVA